MLCQWLNGLSGFGELMLSCVGRVLLDSFELCMNEAHLFRGLASLSVDRLMTGRSLLLRIGDTGPKVRLSAGSRHALVLPPHRCLLCRENATDAKQPGQDG